MTRIKELRKLLKLTQAKFADSIGVSRSAVAMWESAGNKPDYETISRITEVFGIPVEYIIESGVFKDWDEILQFLGPVTDTLKNLIPADLELPAFCGDDNVSAWIDKRYYDRDELKLIRWFSFAIERIRINHKEDVGINGDNYLRAEVSIAFTKTFLTIIASHTQSVGATNIVKAYTMEEMAANFWERHTFQNNEDRAFELTEQVTKIANNTKKAPPTRDEVLISSFHQLNAEGQEVVIEYTDTMVRSGKYAQDTKLQDA